MTVDLRLVAARVAKGDAEAFRQVVDLTRAPLFRLAARLVGDLGDAEDVLQDAYVSAYKALVGGAYDGRSKLETWLYRIVTNASVDALRRRRTRGPVVEASNDVETDDHVRAEARVALSELEGMLAELSADERAAIVLVAVEGLTTKAAAEALNCSEGAVEQRLVRARKTLRAARGSKDGRARATAKED
ncbi:MAG: RNA polymerase sigma factor [Polyangiaceae bacterium]